VVMRPPSPRGLPYFAVSAAKRLPAERNSQPTLDSNRPAVALSRPSAIRASAGRRNLTRRRTSSERVRRREEAQTPGQRSR
jgi:hypothetical protein